MPPFNVRTQFERFAREDSHVALDELVTLDATQKAGGKLKFVKAVVDRYDLTAKDLERERHHFELAFLYRTAAGTFYEAAGYPNDAAYTFDHAARLAHGFFMRSGAQPEEREQWLFRRLVLRSKAAELFEGIGDYVNAGHSCLYVAEVALTLKDIPLAEFYARKGTTFFLQERTSPKNHPLREIFSRMVVYRRLGA